MPQTDIRSGFNTQDQPDSNGTRAASSTPRRASSTTAGRSMQVDDSPATESSHRDKEDEVTEDLYAFTRDRNWLGCSADEIKAK